MLKNIYHFWKHDNIWIKIYFLVLFKKFAVISCDLELREFCCEKLRGQAYFSDVSLVCEDHNEWNSFKCDIPTICFKDSPFYVECDTRRHTRQWILCTGDWSLAEVKRHQWLLTGHLGWLGWTLWTAARSSMYHCCLESCQLQMNSLILVVSGVRDSAGWCWFTKITSKALRLFYLYVFWPAQWLLTSNI